MSKDCGCEKRKKRCCKVFEAVLSGLQENPPVQTSASGYVRGFLKDNTLKISGYFKNLEGDFAVQIAGGSHIHDGIAGRNGQVVFTLVPKLRSNKRSGCFKECLNTFELSDEQVRSLMDRFYYINIHSDAYPSGELRGQLLPKSHKYFLVNLSGSHEVPPIESRASGTLVAELEHRRLTVTGSFKDLSSPILRELLGGAHIHDAPAGQNGPVVFPLGLEPPCTEQTEALLLSMRNVYDLTCDQEDQLMDENYYANIHSVEFPSGELRGQFKLME